MYAVMVRSICLCDGVCVWGGERVSVKCKQR